MRHVGLPWTGVCHLTTWICLFQAEIVFHPEITRLARLIAEIGRSPRPAWPPTRLRVPLHDRLASQVLLPGVPEGLTELLTVLIHTWVSVVPMPKHALFRVHERPECFLHPWKHALVPTSIGFKQSRRPPRVFGDSLKDALVLCGIELGFLGLPHRPKELGDTQGEEGSGDCAADDAT